MVKVLKTFYRLAVKIQGIHSKDFLTQLGIQLCPNQGKVGKQNTHKVGMGANIYFKRHRLRQYNQFSGENRFI